MTSSGKRSHRLSSASIVLGAVAFTSAAVVFKNSSGSMGLVASISLIFGGVVVLISAGIQYFKARPKDGDSQQ